MSVKLPKRGLTKRGLFLPAARVSMPSLRLRIDLAIYAWFFSVMFPGAKQRARLFVWPTIINVTTDWAYSNKQVYSWESRLRLGVKKVLKTLIKVLQGPKLTFWHKSFWWIEKLAKKLWYSSWSCIFMINTKLAFFSLSRMCQFLASFTKT